MLYPDREACTVGLASGLCWIQEYCSKHRLSKSAISDLYKLLSQQLLPQGNRLLSDFYAASKMLAPLSTGYRVMPACPNDCHVSDKAGVNQTCPECGSKLNNERGSILKPFREVSLSRALQLQFLDKRLSQEIETSKASPESSGLMKDIWGRYNTSEVCSILNA